MYFCLGYRSFIQVIGGLLPFWGVVPSRRAKIHPPIAAPYLGIGRSWDLGLADDIDGRHLRNDLSPRYISGFLLR